MAAGSRIAGAAPFGNNLQKTNEDNEVIGSGGGRLNNFVGKRENNYYIIILINLKKIYGIKEYIINLVD